MSSFIPSLLGAATSAVPVIQSHNHHRKEMETSLALHRRAIEQAGDFHQESVALEERLHVESIGKAVELHHDAVSVEREMHAEQLEQASELHLDSKDLAFRLHLEQLQQELQHHSQQMTHATETARRENLRDVWSQKSRRAETLLITTTLMFGCFFAIIVEGIPPQETWPSVLMLFSVGTSGSFFCLFLCIWFTMKYQARMANFNIYNKHQLYTCGKTHTSFESYYFCHCRQAARIASRFFYAGALLLTLAATSLMFARFAIDYRHWAAAYTYVTVSALAVLLLAVLYVAFPTNTRQKGARSKEDTFTGALREHMRKYHERDVDPVLLHPDPKNDPLLAQSKPTYMPSKEALLSPRFPAPDDDDDDDDGEEDNDGYDEDDESSSSSSSVVRKPANNDTPLKSSASPAPLVPSTAAASTRRRTGTGGKRRKRPKQPV